MVIHIQNMFNNFKIVFFGAFMDLHMVNNRKASFDSNPNFHILEVSMSIFCNYSVILLFPFEKCFQFMIISRYCTGIVE